MEIDHQAELAAGQPQVRQHYWLDDCRHNFGGLQLDNDAPSNEKVQSIAALELQVAVNDGNWLLPLEGNPSRGELPRQTLFINGLKQSRAKRAMDLDGRTDNCVGELSVVHGIPLAA